MAPLTPLWGGRPAAPCSAPLSSPAHPSPVYAFCRGPGAAPGAGCGLPPAGQPGGGGGGGAVREPPLRGSGQGAGWPGGRVASVRPSALPGRATLRASSATLGPWGRGPHTAPVHFGAPPPGVARALFLRAGAGSPACRDPRGGGQWGVWGRAACRSSCVPLPGVTVLSGGGGTPPWPRGGERVGAPVVRRPGGSGGERGGGAAPLFPSPPPWGAARGPPAPGPSSAVHPPWVYTGRPAVVGAGRGPAGRWWVSAGGGGRGFLAMACSPAFPRQASRRAASSAYSWVPPCCCGPRRRRRAAGRQRVMLKRYPEPHG